MGASLDLDPLAVRRQFGRRALARGPLDFLSREAERRLLERLSLVRMQPSAILDLGCGQGLGLAALAQRYPKARLYGCDAAPAMLRRAVDTLRPVPRGWLSRFARSSPVAQAALFGADVASLPLRGSSVDLLWSNLALPWIPDPAAAFDEWHRVIRPEGLLSFTALGVDSLLEIRRAGALMAPFPDMHDLGDLLVAAGFAEPVMDVERIVLTYRDAQALLDDVRALGGNALRSRFRGLTGRGRRQRWLQALEAGRGSDGLLRLTIELVFGHAWCPAKKRLPGGLSRVEFIERRAG
jgi:malonyl-CoA O-methyltransferase